MCKFEIMQVEKAGWKIYDAPDNPFAGRPPYKATRRATDGKPIWVWTSSVLPATANNQQYKMTFKIFDEHGENGDVDPDVVCGNPPPIPLSPRRRWFIMRATAASSPSHRPGATRRPEQRGTAFRRIHARPAHPATAPRRGRDPRLAQGVRSPPRARRTPAQCC